MSKENYEVPGPHADMEAFGRKLDLIVAEHLDASTGIPIRKLLKVKARKVRKGGYCLGHIPTSLKGTTIRPD